ncbi:MAG: NnrS family protein [Sphingomonadales bacterium]
MARSPAILRGGFRPFFAGGAAWAVTALVLWLLAFDGRLSLPIATDMLAWHRHEMLFGFVAAIIAGFLLTAIPNWTGRLPIAGGPLAALWGLWFAGRLAMLFSAVVGPLLTAIVDVSFFLVLGALCAREVLAAKNRNVPAVGILLLLGVADAIDHAAMNGLIPDAMAGVRAAIGLVMIMISLIGGRIIPSFTRNWMMKQGIKQGLPGQPTRFDLATIGLTAAAMLAWVRLPGATASAVLLIAAALLQAVRLSRWRGLRAIRDPLVLVLHVGYAWVPAGLLLLGLSIVDPGFPRSSAVHALTAGAMASMILAVSTRATLGHTGHDLRAGGATSAIYLLVTAGALLRVIAPFGLLDYLTALRVAGIVWGAAFLLFLIVYGPILFRRRRGEG